MWIFFFWPWAVVAGEELVEYFFFFFHLNLDFLHCSMLFRKWLSYIMCVQKVPTIHSQITCVLSKFSCENIFNALCSLLPISFHLISKLFFEIRSRMCACADGKKKLHKTISTFVKCEIDEFSLSFYFANTIPLSSFWNARSHEMITKKKNSNLTLLISSMTGQRYGNDTHLTLKHCSNAFDSRKVWSNKRIPHANTSWIDGHISELVGDDDTFTKLHTNMRERERDKNEISIYVLRIFVECEIDLNTKSKT